MRIAIIGFGVEGRAVLKYFLAQGGHEITVCDIHTPAEKSADSGRIHFKFGPHYLNDLSEFDLIFRSPGIPYLKPEFSGVRDKITSATKYFFEHCPCPTIGVTGTKGKGTVSTLIYEMLKEGKVAPRIFLGGNIGKPAISFLDGLKKNDLAVLELSSFQLQDLAISPHTAVVLGISPDHLDYHKTMEEYIEAKKNIVKYQKRGDIAVFDMDNETSASFAKCTAARILESAFVKAGSFVVKDGKKGMIFGKKEEINLIGEHNVKNLLIAATIAAVLGAPVEAITKITREFKGLPHRLEPIKEIAGARYYDDSASTNPETAIAAVRAFSGPLILIAGGSDKNADFTALGEEIAARPNIRTVILMGTTKLKIEKAISKAMIRAQRHRRAPLEIIFADSYHEAFMVAKMIAAPGDTVLLSPACASFDSFKNYAERGEVFKNFVLDSGLAA